MISKVAVAAVVVMIEDLTAIDNQLISVVVSEYEHAQQDIHYEDEVTNVIPDDDTIEI